MYSACDCDRTSALVSRKMPYSLMTGTLPAGMSLTYSLTRLTPAVSAFFIASSYHAPAVAPVGVPE